MPSSGQQVSESPGGAELGSALVRMFSGRKGRRDSRRTTLLWLPLLTKADLAGEAWALAEQAQVAHARFQLLPFRHCGLGGVGHAIVFME